MSLLLDSKCSLWILKPSCYTGIVNVLASFIRCQKVDKNFPSFHCKFLCPVSFRVDIAESLLLVTNYDNMSEDVIVFAKHNVFLIFIIVIRISCDKVTIDTLKFWLESLQYSPD